MLVYFSEKLNFTYPWARYDQLVIDTPFMHPMSLTGLTVLNTEILLDERAAIDQPNSFSLATDVARQWFGHLINADYWSDIWLTESLPRFLGLMYIKSTRGDAEYFALLNHKADQYFEEAGQYKRPLAWNQWPARHFLIDEHAMSKGVWFFHSLYEKLGEEGFWMFIQELTRKYAFRPINTDQLLTLLSEENDAGFGGFFDDWVYSAGHPVLNLDYQYDLVSESLYVSVEQLQEGYLVPPVFQMDLTLETYSLAGPSRHKVTLTEQDQLFSIPLSLQPRYVILDPDHELLAATSSEQSANAWVSQLRYASHPLSQLRALDQLQAFADDPALLIGLQSAMQSRPIPEVRAGIIELIALLPHSDATYKMLLNTYEQDDSPVVKRAVLQSLEQFENKADLHIIAMEAAQSAESYLLQAQAVASLIKTGIPKATDLLQSALITPSYKDIVRRTAIRSIEHTDLSTRERVKIAQDYSKARNNSIEVRLTAMELLASLAGLQNKQSLTSLSALVNDDESIIRQAAITHLKNIGAATERETLEKRLEKERNPRVVYAIEDALRTLNSSD